MPEKVTEADAQSLPEEEVVAQSVAAEVVEKTRSYRLRQ